MSLWFLRFSPKMDTAGDGTGGGGAGGGAPAAGGGAAAPTGGAFDWNSAGLDADTLGYVQNKGWKGVPDALTSYRNLEKLTGVPADKLIKLPKDNNPEEWNQVYSKLGRPESADKYDIPLPEGDNGELAKVARGWFHENGLSVSQARGVAEKFNGYLTEQLTAQQARVNQEHQAQVVSLKGEWGDKYDANSAVVDRAAKAFGMTAEHVLALRNSMGPSAAMKFLYNIGSKIAVEDSELLGGGGTNPGFNGMSVEQAQSRIGELRKDRAFVERFNSPDPKTRQEARAEMQRLHRIAYPS